jgi:hypothetical protein
MAEDADEDLLGHVFPVLGRNSEIAQRAQHRALVAIQEPFQGSNLAPAGCLDERRVVVAVHPRIHGSCPSRRGVGAQKGLRLPRMSTASTE